MLRYVVVLGSFVLLLSTAAREAGAALYYPHAVTRAGWSTEICVANTSAADSVRGTFRAFSDAGLMLAESAPVTLAANATLAASIPNLLLLEMNQTYNPLRDELFKVPLVVKKGYMDLPAKPGFGVELIDNFAQKYPYIPGSYAKPNPDLPTVSA